MQKIKTTIVTSASLSESEYTWMYSNLNLGLEFLGHSRAMLANRMSFWLNINGKKQLHGAEQIVQHLAVSFELWLVPFILISRVLPWFEIMHKDESITCLIIHLELISS
jgi:hypothetical protein